jgi:hypothetical protein
MESPFDFALGDGFAPEPDDEIVEDYRAPFTLLSTNADAADEAFLLKVVDKASELTLTRSTKTRQTLTDYTFKLPQPQGPKLKALSVKYKLPYTYLLRTLTMMAIEQLECPTEALRVRLEQHLRDVDVRRENSARNQREYMGVSADPIQPHSSTV